MIRPTPRQKRAKARRDAHNEAMRPLLPKPTPFAVVKRRAERVMAAHDAALLRKFAAEAKDGGQ